MSLDTVVQDIREQARARADDLREGAERDAEEVIEEAERDAEEILAESEREVERDIEQERDQKISSANLEAKQERLEARRDLLESVRAEVEAEIADVEGERREQLTEALLAAAAAEFEDADVNDVAVYGRNEDRELIEDLIEEYAGFTYAGEYNCLGGVVVESEASRLRVNNTFDSVLDEVWADELRSISERLFDK